MVYKEKAFDKFTDLLAQIELTVVKSIFAIGVNTQVIYKFSEKRFRSMKSHFNFTLGVVYNFNFSLFNRKRIWEVKH